MNAKAETLNIDIPKYMQSVGERARAAAREAGRADSGMKDAALLAIATEIENSGYHMISRSAPRSAGS